MQILMAIYPRPLDEAAFRAHYETVHVPLARKLPGLRECSFTYDCAQFAPDDNIFCVFQAVFDSPQDLAAALHSQAGAALAADTPNYATGGMQLLTFPQITGGK